MTTASDLILSAYREGNLLPISQPPSSAEQDEALARLNAYVNGVFGHEMGEGLFDWEVPAPLRTAPLAANYPQLPYPSTFDATIQTQPLATSVNENIYLYPPKNSRIVFGGADNMVVYFPESPDDGSRMGVVQGVPVAAGVTLTLDGNGRTLNAQPTQAFVVPLTAQQWLYRADLGDWRPVADMALTDDCPFPKEMDDLFITALAIRLSSRYGKEPSVGTINTFKTMLAHLKARYHQAGVTVYGAGNVPRSYQSYNSRFWW